LSTYKTDALCLSLVLCCAYVTRIVYIQDRRSMFVSCVVLCVCDTYCLHTRPTLSVCLVCCARPPLSAHSCLNAMLTLALDRAHNTHATRYAGTSMALPAAKQDCGNAPPAPPAPKCPQQPPLPAAKSGTPNIVLFLTDDMDHLLGGWTPMTQADRLMAKQGAVASNW
jgi:hypothetical protein